MAALHSTPLKVTFLRPPDLDLSILVKRVIGIFAHSV